MVTLSISNKTFYLLLAIIGLLAVVGFVYADTIQQWQIHGHNSTEIGNLPSGTALGSNCVMLGTNSQTQKGVLIDVPDECRFPSTCTLVLTTVYDGDNLLGMGISQYTQMDDGKWASTILNRNNILNGDDTSHSIIDAGIQGYYRLYDDTTTAWDKNESNSNQWTLVNDHYTRNTTLYLCN